ncbi:hypothetical protein Anapl_15870 [Anas platyrhynchos]|uniref:Uncharacterized protein n=1 Tax=Anas platyrhynchos TaxID=8839 RepID=R0L8W9_ANAPL|nr:hypothetical protein Anapl_15870 [Anas platyrhynchos]
MAVNLPVLWLLAYAPPTRAILKTDLIVKRSSCFTAHYTSHLISYKTHFLARLCLMITSLFLAPTYSSSVQSCTPYTAKHLTTVQDESEQGL